MKLSVPEIRDWFSAVCSGVGFYLAWRWHRQDAPGDESTGASATPAMLNLQPSRATFGGSLGMTAGPRHIQLNLSDTLHIGDQATVEVSNLDRYPLAPPRFEF